MEGEPLVVSHGSQQLPKTAPAGQTVRQGTEGMAARKRVAAMFSSSSLSLPASIDSISPAYQLRAPQLVAKPPSLLKASQGFAESTAIRRPLPPCVFILRGKRHTRGQRDVHQVSDGGRPATADRSLSRPLFRINTGQGFSSRLRSAVGAETCLPGNTAARATVTDRATEPLPPSAVQAPPQSRANANRPFTALIDDEGAAPYGGTAAASDEYKPVSSCYLISSPCGGKSTTIKQTKAAPPSKPYLVGSRAIDTKGPMADAAGRWSYSQTRTKTPEDQAATRELSATSSRRTDDHLCGRLCTGRSSSLGSGTARPRIFFLVSGQQQQLKDPFQAMKRGELGRDRQKQFLFDQAVSQRRQQLSVKNRVTTRTAALTSGDDGGIAVAAPRPHSGIDDSCSSADVKGGQGSDGNKTGWQEEGARDDERSARGSMSGETYDATTTAAMDGKGDISGDARKVLCVREPRPPPTSVLLVGSVPPKSPCRWTKPAKKVSE